MLKSTPKCDVSDGEMARILTALRARTDPGKLPREIASRHPEDPRATGRLVDVALACLWLVEGAPAGDVLTMLECWHRFELSSATCRVYALEILWLLSARCRLSNATQILPPRSFDMPLLEIVQTTHVNATVRLEESTATLVDQYAAFLHAPADEVVDKALAYVFSKDRDFQGFLRTPKASHVASSLRVRRLGQNGSAPESANGATKTTKAPEVSNESRQRS